ncbi:fumarylpyruvate hydrolase [Natronocella acetinitrilica]|uniref:Fumarylpyruvate hydrolase n=1 Tax=Natronocella acetinitrilica TaxID=414046 RepID=A0AAE3G680_9GAMM|nr:fumarylacetoacetate hydrolase family protein [Natronocella acetinitrilica]MCP1675163.1 fumarylpyruvate hydrolase [Natronocella acetinitrilica]
MSAADESRYVLAPPPVTVLPVQGDDALFPVRRVYCVGRNYAAHAVEMGHDPNREPPFFFQKNPDNLLPGEHSVFPYPAASQDVHHEVELVVALSRGGRDISASQALACVWGYAVGIDMTRRDLQAAAKAAGRPWEVGKAFEHSAPCGSLAPVARVGHPQQGDIRLLVNGVPRQQGDLKQMIWTVPEIIAHLSALFELCPGDLIMTGTPAGVGAVARGDILDARIAGVGAIQVTVV